MNILDAMMGNQNPINIDILAESNAPKASIADLQNQAIPKTPMAQRQAGVLPDQGGDFDLKALSQSLQQLSNRSKEKAPALGLANAPQMVQQPAMPMPAMQPQQPSQAAQAIQGGIGAQPNMQQLIAMLRGV